ncbi:MAG: signal peptidase I, partial [Acidimicrobiales bacterium]
MTPAVQRARRAIIPFISTVTIIFVAVVVGALIAGYRPVVIQTGSMGQTAPPGSMIIAMPRAGEAVQVGDILVMMRPDLATITHRVIEVERADGSSFAITQGDANESPDATPYPLDTEQLVSRWVLKGWGHRLQTVFEPGIALGLVALATLAVAVGQLRRIWRDPSESDATRKAMQPRTRTQRRRRKMAVAALPLTIVMTVGVAWAMFQSSEVVASNDFSTSACFDAQLGSVQSGEAIHAVSGVVQIPITAVDPNNAFLMLSTRSSSNRPVGSTVRGILAGGGVRIELSRATNAGAPAPITVAWSVVEYSCGVSVQRGTVSGNGTNQIDVSIPLVDPSASFVLVNSEANPSDQDFDADDLYFGQLTSGTNLRISSAAPLDSGRTFSWQVVSFDDSADIAIENVSTTLAAGVTTGSIALSSPVDESSTFLLGAATSASSGPNIGERLIRTYLSSPTSIAVSRLIAGGPIDVHVQVVTLKEGSAVRHGIVFLGSGTPTVSVAITPVDTSRSTAISTMTIGGASASGST